MLLSAEQLHKSYGTRVLLDDASLYLERGDKVGVVGLNGAGKSTLARALAQEMGYLYVDTGAIYRTVGLAVQRRGVDPSDPQAVEQVLGQVDITMGHGEDGQQRMYLDGEDVSQAIRQHVISGYASKGDAFADKQLSEPHCPVCGAPMAMNLRTDMTFVEDEGWHEAARRYEDFLDRHKGRRVLFLELGVGGNTPVIIKYPFWRMTQRDPKAVYACINREAACAPGEIRSRAICIQGDIGAALDRLRALAMTVTAEGAF